MKIRNAILAGILVAGLPVAVQAQEVENYTEYQVGCEAGVECNDFNVNYEQQPETSDELSQRTRTRRTRSRRSDFKKIYVGATIGISEVGEVEDTDFDIGFGGSILGGYRLSEKIAAELEIYDYFGGTEVDDLGYSYLGIAANASFRFPFGRDAKSLYGFLSPGIGYGRLGATGDVADDADDAGLDTSASGFLAQVKAGVGYPISDSISLIGQARYSYLFLGESDLVPDGDDVDAFTFDVGATFGF